jgi:hypothetical protein
MIAPFFLRFREPRRNNANALASQRVGHPQKAILRHSTRLAFSLLSEHICAMNSRVKIITEQALSLPVEEREELLIALAASLGRHPFDPLEDEDGALSDGAKQYLKDAWDKGIVSGPGKHASIEDIIGEARRRLSGERG